MDNEVNNNTAEENQLKLEVENLSLSGERPSKKEAWAIQNQGSKIKNDSKKDADTCTNQSPATTILEDSQSEDLPNEDFKKHAWEISATNEKRLVNVVNDNSLFDIVILKNLPSVQEINAKNEYLYVRPLQGDDFHRGYIDLLKQLTSVGNVSESDFTDRFLEIKSSNETYFITVIVDSGTDKIVGAATLIKERKFIHKCANRGIIEDVIISDQYRGKSLGKLIINCLIELGKSLGCYKITLNCTDKMITFYERLGFVKEESNANFLVIRVDQK